MLGLTLGLGLARGGIGRGRRAGDDVAAAASPALPSFRDVVATAKSAVVGVRCLLHPSVETTSREGTGFVLHGDGLVLTAAHLVRDRMLVWVEVLGHGRVTADVVGEDELTDIAVLRLHGTAGAGLPSAGLASLQLGRSSDLHAGDWVVSIGRPLARGHTVTAGLVSSHESHLQRDDARITASVLQFSAAVNPGSSGSPVLDLAGKVVGMATDKSRAGEGVAFAVPSDVIAWVLARMEEHGGQVPRGYLGLSLEPGAASEGGARVVRVERGGPAWLAGLRARDVVLEFGGQPVPRAEWLYDLITRAEPRRSVDLVVRSPSDAAPRRLVAVVGAGTEAAATTESGGSVDRAPDRPSPSCDETAPPSRWKSDSSQRAPPERTGASH